MDTNLGASLPTGALERNTAPGREAAIQVEHLFKRYGQRRVVDDLSFSIASGEIFALLGPNGAGKTTTIEMLEGYRRPDAGSIRVLGLDPHADAARLRQHVGLMLQQGGIYPAITPREILRLFAAFYQNPADAVALLERVGLTGAATTRYRRLSGGQQRRLALAVALIGRPAVVFLDEPTAGMDPQGRLLTWEIIRGLKERGVTVLFTTHLMDEAQRLADRVAIIDHGNLLRLGAPLDLLRMQRSARVSVRLAVPVELDTAEMATLSGAEQVRQEGRGVYILETADAAAFAVTLTAWLRDRGIILDELRMGSVTLEEVFLQLTGRELRE